MLVYVMFRNCGGDRRLQTCYEHTGDSVLMCVYIYIYICNMVYSTVGIILAEIGLECRCRCFDIQWESIKFRKCIINHVADTVALTLFILHLQDLIDSYHVFSCNTTNIQKLIIPLSVYKCPCPPQYPTPQEVSSYPRSNLQETESGEWKQCWQKGCWQIYAHGLHRYVGAHSRVAPLRSTVTLLV